MKKLFTLFTALTLALISTTALADDTANLVLEGTGSVTVKTYDKNDLSGTLLFTQTFTAPGQYQITIKSITGSELITPGSGTTIEDVQVAFYDYNQGLGEYHDSNDCLKDGKVDLSQSYSLYDGDYVKLTLSGSAEPVGELTTFHLTEGSSAALYKDVDYFPTFVEDITDGFQFDFKAADIDADAEYYIVAAGSNKLTQVTNADGTPLTINDPNNLYNYHNYATIIAGQASTDYTITTASTIVTFDIPENQKINIYSWSSSKELEATLTHDSNTLDMSKFDPWSNLYVVSPSGSLLLSVTDAEGTALTLKAGGTSFPRSNYVTLAPYTASTSYKVEIVEGAYVNVQINTPADATGFILFRDSTPLEATPTYAKVRDLSAGTNSLSMISTVSYAVGVTGSPIASVKKDQGDDVEFANGNSPLGDNIEGWFTFKPGTGGSYTITLGSAAAETESTVSVNKAEVVEIYAQDAATREFTSVATLAEGDNAFTFDNSLSYAFVAAEGETIESITDADGNPLTVVTPAAGEKHPFATQYAIITAGTASKNYTIVLETAGDDPKPELPETWEDKNGTFNFSDFNSLGLDATPSFSNEDRIEYEINPAKQVFVSSDGALEVSFGKGNFLLYYSADKNCLQLKNSGTYMSPTRAGMKIKTVNSYAYLRDITITSSMALTADKGSMGTFTNGTQTWTADPQTANAAAFEPTFAPATNLINEVTFTNTGGLGATNNIPSLQVNYFNITTGIEKVESVELVAPKYFDLQGRQVLRPSNGIYIRVAGNKVDKVAIR